MTSVYDRTNCLFLSADFYIGFLLDDLVEFFTRDDRGGTLNAATSKIFLSILALYQINKDYTSLNGAYKNLHASCCELTSLPANGDLNWT